MFLHLGGDTSVLLRDVVGIFDLDSIKDSPATKEFLEIARDEGLISMVGTEDKIKSFIITKEKVYYSPISSITLQKRALNIMDLEDGLEEQ
ncbi:MAG: extracellular matrix regulator RemB [Bacillota bacterium]|uniref:DUF370 domain-containing protein n=1 Tax=Thermanaerosceptrum fracticalcis TaxID=1712410 RepID=A0A7G6E574_THEFR|nr:extracellular matrix/biofilm biosynthesis regulator RemA family protein [Thermanaerosceptrum fracticalcis]QNB47228.1 DUF370 domain-containing protein [Thermanaerosceptrum fracticalcis]